uniref:CAP_C domain-containing protein n=1 Tax=Schistocephalus solidus TaxID=70667 RepID=A0A183SMS4_SCHSO
LVEKALEMFRPSRQDLHLLNSLGGGEEVLPSVPVRVPVDLCGFADHPDILHLPQPLLYKVVTSVEGCLVCSGRMINVGFVQLVRLDELRVDGCVVVIEPVLVLTTCVAEDIQGGVPQLVPAVLYGGVYVNDWKAG